MSISTHVLDTARGCPAAGLPLSLSILEGDDWRELGGGTTNDDGRVRTLIPEGHTLTAGVYRMRFETGVYHEKLGIEGFYPRVDIRFNLRAPEQHYHVPLLLSPFGYSTYRGS